MVDCGGTGVSPVRRAETPRRLVGSLLERLEERGVTYLGPDRGVVTSIYFKDPDGIQIELIAEPLRIMDGRGLGV